MSQPFRLHYRAARNWNFMMESSMLRRCGLRTETTIN